VLKKPCSISKTVTLREDPQSAFIRAKSHLELAVPLANCNLLCPDLGYSRSVQICAAGACRGFAYPEDIGDDESLRALALGADNGHGRTRHRGDLAVG
jgi:hypothetical protein